MIATASIIAFVIATLGITYQDFKARAIHILFLGLLLGLGFWEAYLTGIPAREGVMSLVFTSITLFGMWLYIGVKNRAWVNPLKAHIGLGDVLFFLVVIPFFSFYSYMLFFVSGLVVSLLVLVLLRKFIHQDSIPLAGILSGYLLILKLLQWLFDLNLFTAKIGLI